MSSVYITRALPGDVVTRLEAAGHSVIVGSKYGIPQRGQVLDDLDTNDFEAVITLLSDVVDEEFLSYTPSIKIVANYATGFDNIDLKVAKSKGVVVTNTPGVLENAVAEHTIALMLSLLRRVAEADRFVRDGIYNGWEPDLLVGTEVRGKTLAIIGGGKIGTRVAGIASKGLGMKIIYTGLNESEEMKKLGAVFCDNLHETLGKGDVISVHVPLLDSTHHLINQEALKMMKPKAFLINTSRGPVVDEKALTDILIRKDIGGAALDVFENEPAVDKRLLELSDVLLTPHIASATHNTRVAMAHLACDNVIEVLSGNKAKTPVV